MHLKYFVYVSCISLQRSDQLHIQRALDNIWKTQQFENNLNFYHKSKLNNLMSKVLHINSII